MSLCERVKAVFNEVNYQCRLLGELVYPRRCAVCKNEIDTGYFCEACRKNFALGKMLKQIDNIDEVFLCYKYHQELQEALQNVKFAGQKDLLPLLKEEARLVLEDTSILQDYVAKYDVICCVPTSPERKAERGFDVPCEIFAFLDSKKWQPNLLKRVRNTAPLFDLEPSLRKQEVAGCFAVEQDLLGKSVLICDDIFTTGSTMCETAEALRKAGAKSVGAIAFAASKDNW